MRTRTIRGIVPALAALAAAFLSPCAGAEEIRTIEIGSLTTTHVVFATDLTYVDISATDAIAAKVVDASKNMLAIKARKEFAFMTTISALESNGTMHTFYVRYNSSPTQLIVDTRTAGTGSTVAQINTQIRPEEETRQTEPEPQQQPAGRTVKKGVSGEASYGAGTGVSVTNEQTSNFGRSDAPTLEEVMRRDQSIFHVGDKCYGIEAYCVNVYAYSDVTYIILTLRNNSDIGYEAGEAQFNVETKKRSAKVLSTDKTVWPKSSHGTLSCAPRSVTKVGYTIPKLTLQENEVLRIYIYEKGGNRNLFLSMTDRDVNYAVSPK